VPVGKYPSWPRSLRIPCRVHLGYRKEPRSGYATSEPLMHFFTMQRVIQIRARRLPLLDNDFEDWSPSHRLLKYSLNA
jgi:hypothetical protein